MLNYSGNQLVKELKIIVLGFGFRQYAFYPSETFVLISFSACVAHYVISIKTCQVCGN
jgi:hypothetical protein